MVISINKWNRELKGLLRIFLTTRECCTGWTRVHRQSALGTMRGLTSTTMAKALWPYMNIRILPSLFDRSITYCDSDHLVIFPFENQRFSMQQVTLEWSRLADGMITALYCSLSLSVPLWTNNQTLVQTHFRIDGSISLIVVLLLLMHGKTLKKAKTSRARINNTDHWHR